MKKLLLILLLLAVAAPARAQSEEARAHFEAGKKAFRLGDYDEAIRWWREGYRQKGDPKFLYNLGQAYREKGDLEKAVHFLRSYLREEKDAPNRQVVETRIAEMEALIAANNAQKTKPPTGPVDADGKTTVEAPPRKSTERRGRRDFMIAGGAVAGGGVLLAVTGIVFRARASSAEDQISRAVAEGRAWDAELQALDDRGRRDAKLSPVFLGLGAAAVVGGGVLFTLGLRARTPGRETVMVPVVGQGMTGVVFKGSF